MNEQTDTPRTVVEVRLNGKLHDLWLEGPEHAVKNALVDGSPYEEARVVENPRGYNFDFLPDLVSSPNKPAQPQEVS